MTPQLAISARSAFELEQAWRRSGPPGFLEPLASTLSCRRDQATWRRVWTFPDARSAAAWNDDWESFLLRGASPIERLLDARVALPLLRRWIESQALEALTEELSDGAPCPIAFVGARVEMTLELAYDASTLPWRRDELTLRLSVEPFGCFDDREPLWTLAAERQVPLHLLPDGAAAALARSRWPVIEAAYRRT